MSSNRTGLILKAQFGEDDDRIDRDQAVHDRLKVLRVHQPAQLAELPRFGEARAAALGARGLTGRPALLRRARLVLRVREPPGQQHAQLAELFPGDEAVLILVDVLNRGFDKLRPLIRRGAPCCSKS